MSDIQKQIRDTLERYEQADEAEEISRAKYIIELECVEWLTHQQQLIDSQAKEIEKLSKDLYELGKNSYNALNTYMKQRDEAQTLVEEQEIKIDEQSKQLELAVKALKHYASQSSVDLSEETWDVGETARTALSEISRLKGESQDV